MQTSRLPRAPSDAFYTIFPSPFYITLYGIRFLHLVSPLSFRSALGDERANGKVKRERTHFTVE